MNFSYFLLKKIRFRSTEVDPIIAQCNAQAVLCIKELKEVEKWRLCLSECVSYFLKVSTSCLRERDNLRSASSLPVLLVALYYYYLKSPFSRRFWRGIYVKDEGEGAGG